MQRYRSIPVIAVLVLCGGLATAQEHGGRFSAALPRFIIFGQKRQGPPPQRQAPPPQQRAERDDRNGAPPNQNQSPMQQRQGDPRFTPLGPGPHAGTWLREHENEPVDQQLRQLQSDPKFKQLPPERQQQLRNRLQNFNNLPPQQRNHILERMEIWEHLTPEERQRAQAMNRDFRQLPEDRRRALNSAVRQLREMGPEDRQKALDSDDYRKNFSDKERDLLRGLSDLRLGANRQENR